jgi:16S rRNA (cytosine967-C5)-methyltransferase
MIERRRPGHRGRPDGNGGGGEGSVRRRGAGPTLARLIAVRVLERVERVRAYADLALHHALAQSNLSSLDRALATELVYGTLRWRGRIDFALAHALERSPAELEPLVLTTLRIGAYQLLFSDRIPDTAAVDEAVRCARAVGAERATGLVNAVLRRVARERESCPLPDLATNPVGHLEHAMSLPHWIAERWLADFGPDQAVALARASNGAPPLTVRANPLRGTREVLLENLKSDFPDARLCRYATHGLVLGHGGAPGNDPRFRAGEYTVQDEAAQLVVELMQLEPTHRVLDVCAAPGTKTTGIAERLEPGGGRVLALDRHANRLSLVARAARRLELSCIHTLVRDATRPLTDLPDFVDADTPSAGARFDRVLIDAPCSGLGAMRRNPDARWRVRSGDPARLAEVQRTLLDRAAEVVAPGGSLVYSTCTVMREENEAVIEPFLDRSPGFRLARREEAPPNLAPLVDDAGHMRCHPHLHDTDGFYAVRLIREG